MPALLDHRISYHTLRKESLHSTLSSKLLSVYYNYYATNNYITITDSMQH